MARVVTWAEVQQHGKEDDLWLVVNNEVYDMTAFAGEHPGGPEIIFEHAGRDATASYGSVHSSSLIRKELGKTSAFIGNIDRSTIPPPGPAESHMEVTSSSNGRPQLDELINLDDFEKAASMSFTPKAWAYIHGGSNDNITRDANQAYLWRIWLRPAVMRNVSKQPDTSTTLFGCRLSMPVYMSPTGAVKMAGGEGELDQARAAHKTGIVQCFATPSSYPHDEILEATPERAWFQLYVDKDRKKSEQAIRRAEASGKVKALFVTVDCPVISKREADERVVNPGGGSKRDKKGAGFTRQGSSFIDASLSWDDVPWLRRTTRLPIVIKGIQRWEDAVEAMHRGVDGIVVSNHGGRAADTAPPSIVALLELRRHCPQVFARMKVLVDGGFRRGSDVVKALCLGASAVGFGRPFMYAVNYGEEGVEHLAGILHDEIRTAMQLCGMTDLGKDAAPELVNTAEVEHMVYRGERSRL
ncbi:putative mitochondrial cytochrome b2 [Microdochium trichocladiopsis]|uniref:Mitochondrial cytochrome b2 n=1 Tax=Microdochium trichocladiopsis TaxID=1682393 RepID=A0A9P8Y679_9PEZI|nr:putative mitochondrial cytochrome b2 [Microdochium trichocladiopsis]KAH7028896.1 putative mitochondrial cytochrome b2 [Microdochium trichocladiopsis]